MNKDAKIYIAGHRGMVGSAILAKLNQEGYRNYIVSNIDLRNSQEVNSFFEKECPEYVFLAAGRVGGIKANNTRRAEFIYDNLMIEANVIHASYQHKVKKLLFLGSSCIYPISDSPIKESDLLTGRLEPTNEAYAIAKIAGIKMCQAYRHQYGCDFISVMPTNLYGPGDNYKEGQSHVIADLIRKFHNATDSVEIWGTGSAKREFLYVEDLAEACILLMNRYSESEIINIGSGEEVTIKELVGYIQEKISIKTTFNDQLPEGPKRKFIDSSKIKALGWEPKVKLKEGIGLAVEDYKKRHIVKDLQWK